MGLDVDAKEAIAFAVMAYETAHARPSNVPMATGAKKSVILGKVTQNGGPRNGSNGNARQRFQRSAQDCGTACSEGGTHSGDDSSQSCGDTLKQIKYSWKAHVPKRGRGPFAFRRLDREILRDFLLGIPEQAKCER